MFPTSPSGGLAVALNSIWRFGRLGTGCKGCWNVPKNVIGDAGNEENTCSDELGEKVSDIVDDPAALKSSMLW